MPLEDHPVAGIQPLLTHVLGVLRVGPGHLHRHPTDLAVIQPPALGEGVEPVHLAVGGVGDHQVLTHRPPLAVAIPGVHHRLPGVPTPRGDVEQAAAVELLDRLPAAAGPDRPPGVPQPLLPGAVDAGEVGGPHLPLEDRQQPSRLDRRELTGVADRHQLGVLGGHEQPVPAPPGLQLPRLVDHDQVAGAELQPARPHRVDQPVDRAGVVRADLPAEPLGGLARSRHREDPAAARLVGLGGGPRHLALAGARLGDHQPHRPPVAETAHRRRLLGVERHPGGGDVLLDDRRVEGVAAGPSPGPHGVDDEPLRGEVGPGGPVPAVDPDQLVGGVGGLEEGAEVRDPGVVTPSLALELEDHPLAQLPLLHHRGLPGEVPPPGGDPRHRAGGDLVEGPGGGQLIPRPVLRGPVVGDPAGLDPLLPLIAVTERV